MGNKRGRKPIGKIAMTAVERMRRYREAKAVGAVQQELTEVEDLKRQIADLQTALHQPVRNEATTKLTRAELTAAQQKKLDTAIKFEYARLQAQYKAEVDAEVERRCALRETRCDELEDKYIEREAQCSAAMAKIDSYMTEDEYKFILNCLHPDRVPEDRKERFHDAFVIFKRLETYVIRTLPLSVLRERGWAR